MAFDASTVEIVDLDYDFRPHVNASGRTPEPTEALIVEFQEATKNNAVLLGRGNEVNYGDPKSVLKFMRSLGKEERLEITDAQLKALANLTQGRPSYEQLKEFNEAHHRLCLAYQASILSDIFNPKGLNLDMNN